MIIQLNLRKEILVKLYNFDPTVDKITITNVVVRHNGTNSTINTTGKISNIQVYSY